MPEIVAIDIAASQLHEQRLTAMPSDRAKNYEAYYRSRMVKVGQQHITASLYSIYCLPIIYKDVCTYRKVD